VHVLACSRTALKTYTYYFPFFTRAIAQYVLRPSVCLSVCLSVTSWSSVEVGEWIELVYDDQAAVAVLQCIKREFGNYKIRVLSSSTLSHTLDFKNVSTA